MDFTNLQAYELLNDRMIEDINSRAILLRHRRTGARIAVLSNDDDNKVFYIGFRTPPKDETGVPHIIEHTVLCGSEKYPVKDPFIELAKGSLNTFLNAMTYPDKTVYPIASCNDQDFKNLMDVYMDAVFHPNITRYKEIFMQEGWHYELESPEAELTINGVVYNEMKGAYSSPDEVLQTAIFRSLFPDNTYSQDSGGNPVRIPELTYEAYLDFYHKYYHPANSYIYLYGDMDVAERLDYLDREYLSAYDQLEVDSSIRPQKAFDQVVDYEVTYSIGSDESTAGKTYLAYNRVVGTVSDDKLSHAFDVLDYALVSAPGAPVKEALIKAGIGEDVYASYDGGIGQPVFSIVAKNTDPSRKEEFVRIIEEVLQQQAEEGISRDALLAAINSAEFRFREADFGMFPKGLLWGLQCLDGWIFDDSDPFRTMECLGIFAELKQDLESGYFEQLIRTYLLDNPHGSMVSVIPDPEKLAMEEKALAEAMAAKKASMTDEEIQAIMEEEKQLRRYQEAEESQENLEKIPLLRRDDMRREAMPLSNTPLELESVPVVLHDIPSGGIHYLSLLFEAGDISEEDLGMLGFLTNVIGYASTSHYSYAALSNATHIYTGGIFPSINLYCPYETPEQPILKFELSVKSLGDNLEKAMELSSEMLRRTIYSDAVRLKEISAQTRTRLARRLASAGQSSSSNRAMSGFSPVAYYQDALRGIRYYRTVCAIDDQLAGDPAPVVDKLQRLAEKLFTADRLTVSYTGTMEQYEGAKPVIATLIAELAEAGPSPVGQAPQLSLAKAKEGFTDASQIQYVALAGNFRNAGYRYTGRLRLLKTILNLDYLWNMVRVKGGAYGVGVNFLRNGDTAFSSYRDPNLGKTLEAYHGAVEYVRNFDVSERDMTKYIIGTFGSIDTPMNPEAKGSRSMRAYFEQITREMIQQERDEILMADTADIRALADVLQAAMDPDAVCVIGNENTIRQEEARFDSISKLV